MTTAYNPDGFKKGREDGFKKGRQDGFKKGFEVAQASSPDVQLNDISLRWREFRAAEAFAEHFGHPVKLNDGQMDCLKETVKSAVWKLEISTVHQTYPVILKIFKAPIESHSLVELNMYRKANVILADLMPSIYFINEEIDGGDVWVFMEYVPQLKGQLIFTPDHFDKIIPSLARMHAQTHNNRFYEHWEVFADWLPFYHSESVALERQKTNKETLEYLDKAMHRPELKERLDSNYSMLQKVLRRGPHYFPELNQAGQSITHNDLQTPNIGCANVAEDSWNIKFIDWEGAKFAPCWFDMFNLAGVFFAYRKDWRSDEEAVIHRCSHLYAAEMNKYGIEFQGDPVRLYKMAYLQRVLERSLYLQLHWATEGHKQAFLLEGYLEKIKGWGKELGLH
ncbi:phosphotransferase [Paenibacillus abyssi]|uniref:Aminoglycoside phosphotransferase domain-containing protein n=1 Tax=Paenibacillus abyssi TaxID=1340531 RepID=A0A917CV97_9BACL|nr:phosphotransferase [Paenibacillus abyssi]GGF98789.1 hypothetical protein GCM10010916_15070 [Paenibacillus abyssi]